MNVKSIQEKAKRKLKKIQRLKKNPRYSQTMGKFVFHHLLSHPDTEIYSGPLSLQDALWAGDLEPRILELLPAILLKKPKMIDVEQPMPEDLKEVLDGIRKAGAKKDFRGIPPKDYLKWIPLIGHRNKNPSLLKTFRFNQADIQTIEQLKKTLGQNEITVVRRALSELAVRLSPNQKPSKG